MRKWSELSEKEQSEIEKRYKAGESPTDIAKDYNLKPKQISDQAYRKNWNANMKEQKNTKKTTAKKTAKKTVKKTAKKAAKKTKK
jgi:uncharacterized protein YjcR